MSNLIQTNLPNGVVETRSYDELNRLTSLENKLGESVISSYEYTLNDVGYRLKVEEHDGRTVEYEYDDLYHLTKESITDSNDAVNDGWTISYTYDNVGNRLSKVDSVEETSTYVYNENDLLIESTTNGILTNYQYDDNGNLVTQTVNGQTTTYTWDNQNRLIEAKTADGDVITYEYNDDNIRVSSTVNGVKTTYLVDSNRPYAQVLEEYQDKNLTAKYVHGLDLISIEQDGETSIYLVDGLGSTRALTDIDGNVVATYDYEAFGNLIDSTGAVENNYLFAGEQFDEELGQYYLRDRYYDQGIGRFTRRDTHSGDILEPTTLHKYIYANADPVNGIDPTGLFTINEQSAVQAQINTLATSSYSTTFSIGQTARVAAGFVALAAGVVSAYILVEKVKNDETIDYKLYPVDDEQKRIIDEDTQQANQMRVQLQKGKTNTTGIALLAVPQVGVIKAQVYNGLFRLWSIYDSGGVSWLPQSEARNVRRAIVSVSKDVKESGPVSGGGIQVATSQWDKKGNVVPKGLYRVDVENIRGTNLKN